MRAALRQILSSDPIDQWARGSIHAWDFLNGTARFNYGRVGRATSTPGWSYTRADSQNAYAQTPGGVLVPFATGQLRRVDGKGVLIEGARTNLCLQSQTFDNASWTKNRSSISANSVTAPDGTTTADTLIEDNTSGQHYASQTIVTTDTATYTLSAFFKAKERSVGVLVADAFRANFNLANGTVSDTAGTPTATGLTALADGWYRCWMVFTADASTLINIGMNSALTSYSYAGDGTSGLYLWGAQLE